MATVVVVRAWHLRWLQPLLYAAAILAGIGIGLVAAQGGNGSTPWITARQLYGLWALAFLLSSMLIGPLVALAPWLPLKAHLLVARRPVGVAAFAFALCHITCYAFPTLLRDWRSVFSPGAVWIVGLALGLTAVTLMVPLAWTSRDKVVAAMGGARWKRLHRIVYVILPIVLLHAVLVGSDFGSHRAPDVKGGDDDSLYIFLSVSIGWLLMVVLRWRRRARQPAAS